MVNGEGQSNIQEPFKLAFLILLPVRDNTAAWTCTPFIIAEFLSVANFGLISIVVYFEIKVYNMVKNSQATGSERAVVENTRPNQRALTAARDPVLWLPPLCWRKLRSVCYVTWLPRHNEERFHYSSAEGISNQLFLWNDRILGGTSAIRRLPRHKDGRFQ